MKLILQEKNKYILRFDTGEEVIEGITKFCDENKIISGFLSGIGAVEKVILSFYDIDNKEYKDTSINEHMEITGIIGNISRVQNNIFVHMHGNFADKELHVKGGHVKKMIVSATCEIVIQVLKKPIHRNLNEETGLNLLS